MFQFSVGEMFFATAAAAMVAVVVAYAVRLKIGREAWPAVKGFIVCSQLRREIHGGYVWTAYVEYEYTVGTKRYLSRDLGALRITSSTSRNVVRSLLEEYPVGLEVIVRYNPRRPSEAFLD